MEFGDGMRKERVGMIKSRDDVQSLLVLRHVDRIGLDAMIRVHHNIFIRNSASLLLY
jgi:hypothetical protein